MSNLPCQVVVTSNLITGDQLPSVLGEKGAAAMFLLGIDQPKGDAFALPVFECGAAPAAISDNIVAGKQVDESFQELGAQRGGFNFG